MSTSIPMTSSDSSSTPRQGRVRESTSDIIQMLQLSLLLKGVLVRRSTFCYISSLSRSFANPSVYNRMSKNKADCRFVDFVTDKNSLKLQFLKY